MSKPIVCDRRHCENRGDCKKSPGNCHARSLRIDTAKHNDLYARIHLMSTTRPFACYGAMLAALTVLIPLSVGTADDAGTPAQRQQQLIAVLRSDAPAADKAIACKNLAIYGSSEAVPELAKLLPDEQLSSWARIALEAIPGTESDAALRAAADSLQGRLLVGTINSIGVRRDATLGARVDHAFADTDAQVASAAAVALGRIGNDASAESLRAALKVAPETFVPRSPRAVSCVRNVHGCKTTLRLRPRSTMKSARPMFRPSESWKPLVARFSHAEKTVSRCCSTHSAHPKENCNRLPWQPRASSPVTRSTERWPMNSRTHLRNLPCP